MCGRCIALTIDVRIVSIYLTKTTAYRVEVEGSLPHKRAPYIDYLANFQSSTLTFKTYHTTRTSSDLMAVVSQTALTHAASWFPGKLPTGYTALPCEDLESKHHDVEACSLRPGSDIETASPATSESPSS